MTYKESSKILFRNIVAMATTPLTLRDVLSKCLQISESIYC